MEKNALWLMYKRLESKQKPESRKQSADTFVVQKKK